MSALRSPIDAHRLRVLLDPESEMAIRHPIAFDVLTRLHKRQIRIAEVIPVKDAIWIRVGPGPNIVVYHTGTILVQGPFFEGGPVGKLLKTALPKTARWQQ